LVIHGVLNNERAWNYFIDIMMIFPSGLVTFQLGNLANVALKQIKITISPPVNGGINVLAQCTMIFFLVFLYSQKLVESSTGDVACNWK
jgi:hypothetical protein